MRRLALIIALLVSLLSTPVLAISYSKKSFCEAAWSVNSWWGDIIAAVNGC